MGSLRDVVFKNREKLRDYRKEFYCIFKVSLEGYFDFVTGFDLTKFEDDIVKSAPDVSMKATVLSRYGREGVAVIKKLLA